MTPGTARSGLCIVLLALGASACGLEEGESCAGGAAECVSATEALLCIEGQVVSLTCRGRGGCSSAVGQMRCDQSTARVGDACSTAGAACSEDGLSFLRCEDHRIVRVARCLSPRGCYSEPGTSQVRCDQTVGEVGQACSDGGACSPTGDAILLCVEGVFRRSMSCPNSCTAADGRVDCPGARAVLGEVCSAGGATCAVDGSAWLQCSDGRWAVHQSCRGPNGCAVDGSRLLCDSSRAQPGDACAGSGQACTMDGMAHLECRDGHFETLGVCRRGCRVEGGRLFCEQ